MKNHDSRFNFYLCCVISVQLCSSEILLNQGVCEITNAQTKRGPNDIAKRQEELAELAVKTWPLAPKK
jgi:hypothetical protein